MAHKDVDITLEVIEVRPETPQHLSVVMRRPRGFDYDPGDWVDFEFDPPLRGGPTYSLSSSPTEADLMVTFRAGNSEVKRLLATAAPGTQLRVTSYGNDYGFTLNENRASMLVAGGVGVAPFRSMVKDMVDTGSRNEVDLVYLNKGPSSSSRTSSSRGARPYRGSRCTSSTPKASTGRHVSGCCATPFVPTTCASSLLARAPWWRAPARSSPAKASPRTSSASTSSAATEAPPGHSAGSPTSCSADGRPTSRRTAHTPSGVRRDADTAVTS